MPWNHRTNCSFPHPFNAIYMLNPVRQREFALEIAQKLRAAGFEALWAGGCVRDELLGLTPKDYDVATSATPDQIRELFGRRRTLPIGASFGVITVLGPREAGQIEVATFRTDATYSDGRHPDSVTFTTAEHDAERRDFTINGLFFDPVAGQVVDYVGGQEDLKAQILRAIGNPRLRLGEDKLRMLRAVRFAAAFNFAIDPDTLAAVQEMAPEIGTVSAERIGAEIRRMLIDSNRATALALLRETNLLVQVLPEIANLTPAALNETSRVLAALNQPSISLALAAALFLVRAPDSPLLASLGRRLRYTNKEVDRCAWLIELQPFIAQAQHLAWPSLQRLLAHDGANELLALHEAIAGPDDPALAFCHERLAWPAERLNPRPLIDGSTLIHHGLTPGPHFSDLLEQVRDAQLNGEIKSQAEALALVDRLRASDNTLP
jgi:poly(A) polymerase